MNEDNPTKDLPNEDATTGDLESASDTRPMLDRILQETITTRDMLLAEMKTMSHKLDAFNKRVSHVETDLAALESRVEKLEEKRP